MANAKFIINRLKSVKYALKGVKILITTEASIQSQLFVSIVIIMLGCYFNISTTEWLFQIIAIVLVISIEGVNTAIEAILDFIHPEQNSKIGEIKDIAAGAVLIASIGAICIGLIIFAPKIYTLLL